LPAFWIKRNGNSSTSKTLKQLTVLIPKEYSENLKESLFSA